MEELTSEADRSLGRVSARAVLNSLRSTAPVPSDSTYYPSLPPSDVARAGFTNILSSPPGGRTSGDVTEVVPLSPPLTEVVPQSKSPPITPVTFPPVSLMIDIDDRPQDQAHRKVVRARALPVPPDIKVDSPSPVTPRPGPAPKETEKVAETKSSPPCTDQKEEGLSLVRIMSDPINRLASSFKSTTSAGTTASNKEGAKAKLSSKPSSRLSVEHQLLGVSTSTLSNCTDSTETDWITVNEAIHTAGIGRYQVLPFAAGFIVIVLKCFLDGVPDNFVNMFQCVFKMEESGTQMLVLFGFLGSIIGTPIGGILADMYGRRQIMGLGMILIVLVVAVITGASHYIVLTIFYVVFSLLVSAVYPIALVYMMELSPTKTRYITLTLTFICYSTVSFILPLVILPLYQQSAVAGSFQTEYWRIPWGFLILPVLLCVGLLYCAPPSPRYSASKGRTKEAQRTCFDMLQRNLGDRLKRSMSSLEMSPNSDPQITGLRLPKLFYRPIQGTTVLLTAFLFVCNVQYFASHVLTEEMLTNRCSCGIDITTKGVPWSSDYFCDNMTAECNPLDVDQRTCCYEGTCVSAEYLNTSLKIETCPGRDFTCSSVHNSIEESSEQAAGCHAEQSSTYFVFNAVRNLLYVIGFVVGILLAQYTTRKDAFIHLSFYITFLNGLLFVACQFLHGISSLILLTLMVFNNVIGSVYSLSWLYMVEYYPTGLRCTGVGYLAGIGQLGNGLGTLLSKYTLQYDLDVYGRLTIHLFLSNLLTVLSFMLELETKRLPMSDRKRADCLDHKLSNDPKKPA